MARTAIGTGFQATDTSRESAESVGRSGRVSVLRNNVLLSLQRNMDGLTTEQIAVNTGEDYKSIQPRLSELRETGAVEDSGNRGTTRFGKKCIIWRIKANQMELKS